MTVSNTDTRLRTAAAALCIFLCYAGGIANAETSLHVQAERSDTTEVTARFIVRAESVEAAASAVKAVGGTVTHELGIIRAVSATLNAAQLRALRENPAIQRISADSNVRAMTL